MKKLFLILLFSFSFLLPAFSQSYLTIGQVYNYNVGDIFEEECGSWGNIPNVSLTTVLGKWYSPGSDTVYYRDSMVFYIPCVPPCTPTFNTWIDTIFYTNLNSIAVQDTEPNDCPPVWDTVYVDSSLNCWQKTWEQGPDKNCADTNNDGNNAYSWLIEGCGGPYTQVQFAGDPPTTGTCTLIYAKKHDTICGNEWIITATNQIITVTTEIKIHPNPSDGNFTFSWSNSEFVPGANTVDIYNVLGEKVFAETLRSAQPARIGIGGGDKPINLSNEPDGVYFYRVISETGGLIGEGKLIIER